MRTLKHPTVAAMTVMALALAGFECGASPQPASAALSLEDRRAAISTAIDAAIAAVAAVLDDSTDQVVGNAERAIAAAAAIAATAEVPPAEKAAITGAVDVLARWLSAAKESRMAAMDARDKAAREAMAKLGKTLHKALTDNPLSLAADRGILSLFRSQGVPVGSLGGGWKGAHYARTDSGTKVASEARVYANLGLRFVEAYGGEFAYTASTRTFDVGDAADRKIGSSAFPKAGTMTFTGAQSLRGTYEGAPGVYKCRANVTCTAKYTAAGIVLSAPWTFVHDQGAIVSRPDADYLYFGWWLRKDKDGMPTAASAFRGATGSPGALSFNLDTIAGSAIYAGRAVGKFAMSNPLDGTGDGGHFTADAMLNAKFGSDSDAGMTGTIDNFRLNDGSADPGWSVKLNRAPWADDGAIMAPTGDNTNKGTVWSINGNAAPASGTWSGTMYDEMPGNAPIGDGNNVPTTLIGTFQSEFSAFGRMVGAFGASRQ